MAGGTFGGGDGSQTNPYLIEDAADLDMVRSYPNKNFKLTENINVGVSPYNSGVGWTPINGFKGYFDGNGKKIYNLYINRPAEDNVGLFGKIEQERSFDLNNAIVISKLVLENVNITGKNNVGALVGDYQINMNAGIPFGSAPPFNTIAVSGKINGARMVGGLIGRLYIAPSYTITYDFSIMLDCFTDATIILDAGGSYVGQLIGATQDANNNIPAVRALNKIYFKRCIGVASLRTQNNVPPAHLGNLVFTTRTVFEDCYIDGSKWPCELGKGNTGLEIVPTAYLMESEDNEIRPHFASYTQYDQWSIENGRYPNLKISSDDYLFVYGDGQYYTYDHKKNEWISHGNYEPSIKDAVANGMRCLEDIPSAAWNTFKTKSNPCIINIMDKASSEETKIKSMNIARDATNSSNSAVFRKKFNFNEDSGVLSAINI